MNRKDDYSDILYEPIDSQLVQHVTQIDTLYNLAEPPAQLSWTRFQLQMHQKRVAGREQHQLVTLGSHRRRRVSLSLVLGMFALLLILSGFAYATVGPDRILGWIFHSEPDSRRVLSENKFTVINQSQTIDGYQVTLDRAYADANHIILGFIITNPHGIDPNKIPFMPSGSAVKLTTQQGQVLQILNEEEGGDTNSPRQDASMMEFDASHILGHPEQLSLSLKLGFECNSRPDLTCKHTLTYTFMLPFHFRTS